MSKMWDKIEHHVTTDNIIIELRLHIRESKLGGRQPTNIRYKNDGSRFKYPCTLKLKTFTCYIVSIEVVPPVPVEFVKIGGQIFKDFHMTSHEEGAGYTIDFDLTREDNEMTSPSYRVVYPCSVMFRDFQEVS